MATHVVGGEFQVAWTGDGSNYNIFLNMYFDDIHAQSFLLDEDLDIYPSIYRKSDQAFMGNVRLTRRSIDFIPNGVEGCNDLSVIHTRLLRYQGNLNMDGYGSSDGYYIVWERCCRNQTILNITTPDNTGEVFYLEFAPNYIKNSTPYFVALTNQFWCKGVTHYLNYSGIDPDGDELRYELITPLAGNSDKYNSITGYPYYERNPPLPYRQVNWASGYNVNAQINGLIPLKVDRSTGIVTFNSATTGLFVFGINVSEYRNGIKIGETRRDFQLLIQNCPVNYPPQIGLDKTFANTVGQVEVFLNEVKSIDLFLADKTTTHQGLSENITFVRVISTLPTAMFQIGSAVMLYPGIDTVKTQLIISPCNYVKKNVETIERVKIVVKDNRCPPMYDTLLLDIKFKIPLNDPPTIEIIPTGSLDNTLYPGDVLNFTVKGLDNDVLDKLTLTGNGKGFNLGDKQMIFRNVSDSSISISSPFLWNPNCDLLNQGPWYVTFTVKDNSCIYSNFATTEVKLNVIDRTTNVEQYRPVNLITANNDGLNDSFSLFNAPLENCESYFKSISVYNAWGARVYYSTLQDFNWKPEGATKDAIYYYSFDFNSQAIDGWIQVIASE